MKLKFVFNKRNYKLHKDYDLTVIQVAELLGITLPRFCYHNSLSIAGNCRMCLVEVNTSVKPVVACGFSTTNNLIINTNTKKVLVIRESILEFLLINHPLDCPICDSAGECDLQDISLLFGNDLSRFKENKRSVTDKNFSPFIKTIMTRCIHCTRCIRFIDEYLYPKKGHIGTLGRGNSTIVSNYFNHSFEHDLSGNLADLCPVGALTHKTYAFTARPWELQSVEYIDFIENINMNIRIDLKGNDIYRIIPIYTKNINNEFISNRTRYFYDVTFNSYNNKVYYVYYDYYRKYNKEFSWKKIINYLVTVKKNNFALSVESNDVMTLLIFKLFANLYDVRYVDTNTQNNLRNKYIINKHIFDLINHVFLLFINLKVESTIFDLKLTKLNLKSFNIGLTNRKNQKNIGLTSNFYHKLIQGRTYFSSLIINNIFNQSLINKELNINNYHNKYLKTNQYFNSVSTVNLNEVGLHNHFTKKNNFINKKSIDTLYEVNNRQILPFSNNESYLNRIIQTNFNIHLLKNVKTNKLKGNTIIIPSLNLFAQYFNFFNIYGEVKKNNQILKFKGFDDFTIASFFLIRKYELKNTFTYQLPTTLELHHNIKKVSRIMTNNSIDINNTYSRSFKGNLTHYLNTIHFFSYYSYIETNLYTNHSKYLKNIYSFNKLYTNKSTQNYRNNENRVSYKKYHKKSNYFNIQTQNYNFYDYNQTNNYY